MLGIGAERFGGVASDNTGNTTLARLLLQEEFSWIIILPDSCHYMSSLCKDIGNIKFFHPVGFSCLLGAKILIFGLR